MADDTAMLTIEPDEPVVHNVRLQQAYRTTVTLRNNTRNAMELTIRAGSPERWAVAPSTVFLEAGRTMRVDLRLKLTRELRPRRLAGGAGAAPGAVDDNGAHRQRDVFHVKSPYFERRFHASFVMATPDEIAAATARDPEDRGRSVSFAPAAPPATARRTLPRSVAERSRSASPGMERPSTSRPHLESTRGRSAPPRARPGSDPDGVQTPLPLDETRIDKKTIRALDERLETLERENRRKDLAARDKDELIRALYSRLELAKTNAPAPAPPSRRVPPEGAEEDAEEEGTVAGDALHAARAKQAELHGANAALRGRCRELDGELQASREEAAGLRRRLAALESDKVPELSNLVAQALAQERSAFEAQSLKALRVLEAKDSVLAARERETAEARAECGALNTTLTATRRELDACEARLITTLEEQGQLRDDAERARAASEETATRLTRERDALQKDLDAATEKMRTSAEALARAVRTEEDVAFLRAEASTATAAAEAAAEEAAGLRAALKSAAELRAAEREQLAAHVAAAEHERIAAARAASADGVELLTAELKRAHENIAATLERSRGDSLLTGAAAKAERAAARAAAASANAAATGGGVRVDEDAEEEEARDAATTAPSPSPEPSSSPSTLRRKDAEIESLRLKVKELTSALRVGEGEARRSSVRADAERAAETEALRTELAALREKLRSATRRRRGSTRASSAEESSEGSADDGAEVERRVEEAETRARAAEAEATATRARLAELESSRAHPGGRRSDVSAAGARAARGGVSSEARLSARVTELARDLEATREALESARARVAELESTKTKTRGSAVGSAVGSAADDRLAEAEARWENERARLESKIRAAKADGSVRVQSLEATVASLRSRSGLHAEVARLGDECARLRRSETRVRGELDDAEERLGRALLDLEDARRERQETKSDGPLAASRPLAASPPLPAHSVEAARRAGASALRGDDGDRARTRRSSFSGDEDRVARLEREASRYQTEIDRLRGEVESAALERGREAAARADASRELATALDRVAERDRALHDARESAALGKERAAATRAHEVSAATRRCAAAEAHASEATAAEAAAREDAREVRAECARRVAAADAARRLAEASLETCRRSESAATQKASSSTRDAERAAAVLEERNAQLRILTETVEALQASAGSGDREQRVVTLAAQAATARASEAALERRCAELSGEVSARRAATATLEAEVTAERRATAAADARADEARASETRAREEAAAARAESAARNDELTTMSRRCDAAAEARSAAEARESSTRSALEAQHARHLEQLAAERDAAAERLREAQRNAARVAGLAGGETNPAAASAEDLLAAARDAAEVRRRVERSLADVAAIAKSRVAAMATTSANEKENDPKSDVRWFAAVIQRLRQLVLEAEREVGRATSASRAAAAGESAANRRAAAAEAALDARTAAWEEATAAAVSAEERLARRAMMHGACAEEHLSLSRRRVAELEEALSAASRGRVAAESAASASAATAETESRRADAAARRARVAEADAAAAKQAAAAAAEELEGSPAGSDAVGDLKAYFESEILTRVVASAGDARGQSADAARLVGVTRELCAAKLTERSLLASLAANRRRADAAAAHAAELRDALDVAETRVAEAERSKTRGDGNGETRGDARDVTSDVTSDVAVRLAARAHEAHEAREEVLRLRARTSELELEVADLAGAREAAAAAATAAREGARAEMAAAAARAAEDFAAKTASLRRDLEAEKSALSAALRDAQTAAQSAKAEAAATISAAAAAGDDAEARAFGAAERDVRHLRDALAAMETRAEKAEERCRKAQRAAAEAKDDAAEKQAVVDALRRSFSALDGPSSTKTTPSASARKTAKKSLAGALGASPNANASPGAGGSVAASPTKGALGRRLVEAKLAEADARRKLKVSARAEAEFQAIVAKRDARIVELKRQLAEKTEALHQLTFASSSRRTDVDASRRVTPTHKISRAAAEASAGESSKHMSVAALAAAAAKRRGEMADTPSDAPASPVREEDTTELGGDFGELDALELRTALGNAEAEVTRLTAELAVSRANAPSPEEMEALQDEATALRRRLSALGEASTRESEAAEKTLQADVNAAVTAAAGALAGTPRPRDARAPAPGTATAAVMQLAVALKETQNLLHKAKQDERDARRVVRETGKEREVAVEAEASQRSIIRELTQRAAQLGRDKAELVDERDALRERIRGLKTSLSRYPDEPGVASTRPPLRLASDAATQAGAEFTTAALVDAVAVGDLLRRHVAGVEDAVAYVSNRAAASGESAMAERANALSVETAAMRAALDAFAADDAATLTPTQLIASAATAAMRAMPSAPLVHTVVPSVVASAMVTAPPMANPETFDAPMATTAKTSVATDVEGLRPITLERGTDAAPVMATVRSGPDGADDPVTLAAPRDAATSPGVGERRRDVSVGVGTRSSPPPGGGGETRDTGSDPAPLTTETATETEVSTALFDVDLTAAEERDRLRAELEARAAEAAATIEKSQKWKSRCESLRGELAETMARLEASGAETTTLRDELTRARSALAAAEEIRDVGDMPASRARAKVAELEEMLATRDGAGDAALRAAKRTAEAAEKEAERLRAELGERDAEHARMISSLRLTIRGMRDSTPADRAAYLEALRLHAEAAERERDARNATVAGDAAPAPVVPAHRFSTDRLRDAEMCRVAFERASALVERVTKAESRLERAAAATAAALEVAERGATRAGRRADEEARAIAKKLEETDVAVERAARRADALRDALDERVEASKAARWTHVTRCARYRELIRRLMDEHESDGRRAKKAVAEAERRADAAEEEASRRRAALELEKAARRVAAAAAEEATDALGKANSKPGANAGEAEAADAKAADAEAANAKAANAEAADAKAANAKAGVDVRASAESERDRHLAPRLAPPLVALPLDAEDAPSEPVVSTTPEAAAAALLSRLLGSRDDAERLSTLETRLRASDAELADAHRARDALAAARSRAERRAKHLAGRVEQLTRAAAEAERALAERGPAAFTALESKLAEAEEREKRARHEANRLKRVSAEAKTAAESLREERARAESLERRLAESESKAKDRRADATRKERYVVDLKRKLDAAVAEAKAVAEAPPKPTDADAKLKLLREEHARLATSTASLRRRAEERAKEAADAATAAERERGEEKTKRLAREVKRKEELIESHDARVDALRAELAAARDDATRVSARLAAADATTRNESVAARRAANATLTGVRALAARLLRLSAAVGHTVGAASRAERPSAGPVEAGIAALVDFEPDEVADLLGADGGEGSASGPAGKESLRLGRASSPESFAALVAAVEMKADEVAASLVRGDGEDERGEGTSSGGVAAASSGETPDAGSGFRFAEASLRWIVRAAEAEAEHAEAALKSAVPAMQDWWIAALSEGRDVRARRKASTRAAGKGTGTGTGTRAKLAGAAALLASSDESESS